MRDLSVIFWPPQRNSRYGEVTKAEGQVVFNRSVMAAAVVAMVFRLATADKTQSGSVLVWMVLVGTFTLHVLWGRWYYRSTGARRPGRVLVIEDDPTTRDLMARVILARGWDVDRAGDLSEAVAMLGREPCIVLVDLGLPDGSGLEIFPYLRRGSRAPRTVVITGASDPDTLSRLKAVSPTLTCYKPIESMDTILDAMGDPFDAN